MLRIESWFMINNFSENERLVVESSDEPIIKKETEKAYLLEFNSDYGTITKWVPKSCTYQGIKVDRTPREKTEEEKARDKEMIRKAFPGLAYNEYLTNYAKENNVKGVRIGMKTATLIEKIKNAGLEVPSRNVIA